jgi:hypothetical protein
VANASTAFISYSRADSEFALRLAADLKTAGANVWLDQLDIEPGTRWDSAVEDALINSANMLVILSSVSVASDNVRDEVSYALSQQMKIIPVLFSECKIPFRLARLQHIDFRNDYPTALRSLLKTLRVEQAAQQSAAVQPAPDALAEAERQRAFEEARLQAEREQQATQKAKREEECKQREQAEAARRAEDAERAATEQAKQDSVQQQSSILEETRKHIEEAEASRLASQAKIRKAAADLAELKGWQEQPARWEGKQAQHAYWGLDAVLFFLWVIGLVSSYTLGGWIHVFLVLAVLILIFNIRRSGRRTL